MKPSASASAVTLFCAFLVSPSALAQARPAPQAPATKAAPAPTPTPAAPARFVKMFKGTAPVDVIQGTPRRVGPDMVTVLKLRNMAPASISLLKVDEYWYDTKRQVATGDSQAYRKPFNPGEVIEITMRSPFKPNLYQSQYKFTHANGDVKVNPVKKFN